jgi:hypothetical protein
MATLAQESEHNLLPPANLIGEIERLWEDLSAERDRPSAYDGRLRPSDVNVSG